MVCTVLPNRNLMVLVRSLVYALLLKKNMFFFLQLSNIWLFLKVYIWRKETENTFFHSFPSSLNAYKCTFGTATNMLCSSPCQLCMDDCGLTLLCGKFFFVYSKSTLLLEHYSKSHDFSQH